MTFICNTKTNPSSRNLSREAHNKNMNFYYDEIRIFPKEAILNQKQELCMSLLKSEISFRSRDIHVFKICKLA